MPREFALTSDVDDLKLCAWTWWEDGNQPRANVIIAHGMGEHARRYDEFAAALIRDDIAPWALDHRGHGRSPGPGGLGDFGSGGWPGLVADINLLTSHAADRFPGAPVILFGHSMGSLAAQQIAIDRSRTLDGVILSGTTCFDLLPIDADAKVGLAAFNAPFEPARTPSDWLSRDSEAVDAYIADPLCGADADPASMASMFAATPMLADPAELNRIRNDLPVLVLAGDADPLNANWTLIDELVRRWRDAGLTALTEQRYAGGRHEMLNETNRKEVIDDLLTWIESVIKAY